MLVGGSSRALSVREAVRRALVSEGFSNYSSPSFSSSSSSSSSEGGDVNAFPRSGTVNSNVDSNADNEINNSNNSNSSSSSSLVKSNKILRSRVSSELKCSRSSTTVRSFSLPHPPIPIFSSNLIYSLFFSSSLCYPLISSFFPYSVLTSVLL